MNYNFVLPEFEGPLDLLLHLIKESNINILDINIVDITNQYLDYINHMQELNLDIASEYIVMAAELIEMKARVLLPTEKKMEDSEEEEDPKEQLINRLLEYQAYKESSKNLEKLELLRSEVYTKDPSDLSEFSQNEHNDYGISLNDLVDAMNKFLKTQELHKPLNTKITNKEYSVEKRSVEIKNIISREKKVSFFKLLESSTKDYIVVTFLAILSLSKNQEIDIKQDSNFKEIILSSKELV